MAIVALISKFKYDHQKSKVIASLFIEFIYFHHKVGVNMYATKALLQKISHFLGSSKNIMYCDLNNKDGCLCPEDPDRQS